MGLGRSGCEGFEPRRRRVMKRYTELMKAVGILSKRQLDLHVAEGPSPAWDKIRRVGKYISQQAEHVMEGRTEDGADSPADAEGKEIVPVSLDRIILSVEDGQWMATFAGPQQGQVAELFGASKLPTPFRAGVDQRVVVDAVMEKNPGMDVVVNGIVMGGAR